MAGPGVTFDGCAGSFVPCSGFTLPPSGVDAKSGVDSDPGGEDEVGTRCDMISSNKGSLVGVAREGPGAGPLSADIGLSLGVPAGLAAPGCVLGWISVCIPTRVGVLVAINNLSVDEVCGPSIVAFITPSVITSQPVTVDSG